jgi:periplasmic copper chaperone A
MSSPRRRTSAHASAAATMRALPDRTAARSRGGSRLVVALSALTLILAACGGTDSTPTIEEAWARSNPNGLGAAYLVITMPDGDVLVAAEVDPSVAARVELHEVVDDEGRMLMREREGGIPLPGGEPVELRPGGLHVMLLDMPAMLEVGATFELTLRFATSDPITVQAEVREGATDGMPHTMDDTMGTMDHGSMHGAS